MENIDFEKLGYNTRFLSKHFFDKKVDFPFDYAEIHQEQVDALKESIEIIESGQYSIRDFKVEILSISAPEFWKDLYLLNYYEDIKIAIEASFEKQQADFNNDPDKDDILFKHRFDELKRFKQKNLEDIDNVINLTKKFRSSINKAFPKLEDGFAKLLQEHNDLQVSEATRIQERDEERKTRIEEKRKQIEENKKVQEQQPRTIKENEIRKLFDNELNIKLKGIVQTKGDRLISSLRIDRTSKKEYSRIAKMMYSSKKITTDRDFKDWLPKFYDLIGIENGTIYKPVDLEPDGNLKQEFDYL